MKEKNQPIGEIECPRKGCDLMAKLFRFRAQAKDDTRRRFAGRLFCVCGAGHRCDDDQEYLLSSKAKIWSPKESAPPAGASKESPPAKPAPKPVPKSQPKPAQKTAPPPKPAATPQPQSKKTWGFW